jgi:glutaredoxin
MGNRGSNPTNPCALDFALLRPPQRLVGDLTFPTPLPTPASHTRFPYPLLTLLEDSRSTSGWVLPVPIGVRRSFLAPYIGEDRARNPLQLGDVAGGELVRVRGPLKAAGRAMGLLRPVFSWQNRLQASLLGADEDALAAATAEIEWEVEASGAVVYTYGLSPFSVEALALLEAVGGEVRRVEVGPEWFLLGKQGSATRAALLEKTGQSSLPSVFIGGRHVGGLFTGSPAGGEGLAALQETGELKALLAEAGALKG